MVDVWFHHNCDTHIYHRTHSYAAAVPRGPPAARPTGYARGIETSPFPRQPADTPLISLDGVRYRYPTSDHWVLDGIDLRINRGELIGIVGSTGAGKSTLCLTLNGLIPHYAGGTLQGSVQVSGLITRDHPVSELADMVGLVFQDADSQLVMSTVEEECMLAPLSQGLSRNDARERAHRALDLLEISHLADRSPRALSGGQKQRTAIAAVLAADPAVLVLDEATSELDGVMVRKLFDFCAALNRERGTTVLIVSHEMELLSMHASRLVVMSEGGIILDAATAAALQQPEIFRSAGVRLPQHVEIYHRLESCLDIAEPPPSASKLEVSIREALERR
jgi:energy-coupling factor transporter ATP-binding protein EcfA2